MGIVVSGGRGKSSLGPEIFKKGLLLNIYRHLRAGSEQKYFNGRKLFVQSPISEQ